MGIPKGKYDVELIRRTKELIQSYKGQYNLTLLMNGILSLIVLPQQHNARLRRLNFMNQEIQNIPEIQFVMNSPNYFFDPRNFHCDLKNLLNRIRNGITHQRIKQLIKMVNDSLVANNSTEKLVVVGPSMGGLVSRWALKELENEGYNHNTRLWISFDAPQQGANIPLSLQFLAEYGNKYSSLEKLNRAAAKQMLVHHYLNNHVIETTYVIGIPIYKYGADGGAPGFRDRFKNELSNLGYPNPTNNISKTRKIALVNGGKTGILNGNPGQYVAYVHNWMNSFPWGNAGFGDLNFSNNSGINQVFKFRKRTGLTSWETTYRYVNSNVAIGSYDIAPGCIIPMTGTYAIGGPLNSIWVDGIRIDGNITQYVDKFTFMPTKSTLDFKGINPLLSERLCDRDLVATHETPFDAYYAPENNEEHVELNTTNVAWLINELNGSLGNNPTPVTCTSPTITSITINGENRLCNSQTKTYTLSPNNLQNVQWSTTNLTIVSSNNQQITVKYTNPLLRVGTITATYGNLSTSKTVRCSIFGFKLNYEDNFDVLISTADLSSDNSLKDQEIVDATWELTHGNGQIIEATTEHAMINGNNFNGKVTLTNADGETAVQYFFWPDPDKCKAIVKVGTDKYQVIDRCNDNEVIDALSIKELYNAYGYKIEDLPMIDQELNLNSGNTGDIQIIRVNSEGENLTKRIIKE